MVSNKRYEGKYHLGRSISCREGVMVVRRIY